MIQYIRNVGRVSVIATLVLAMSGCSVFISAPKVAHVQIQKLDDKLIEYQISLDEPTQSNLGIRLSENYSLQFDFDWLLHMDAQPEAYASEVHVNAEIDFEEPLLTPWMLCTYRF